MDNAVMHDILVKTRNYLAQHGHTKWALQDRQGRVCLYGALEFGAFGADWSSKIHHVDFPHVLGFSGPTEAVLWNNAPERTEQEVLARLDEAIARTAPEPEDIELSAPSIEEENKTYAVI